MKTYLQVDMNEYFQAQMETELFDFVFEEDKAKFIGNFFSWIRNLFKKEQPKKKEPYGSLVEH
jgi:hypothetical protein